MHFFIFKRNIYHFSFCLTDMKSLEEEVARYVIELGKVPVGWEEMLFSTGVVSLRNYS